MRFEKLQSVYFCTDVCRQTNIGRLDLRFSKSPFPSNRPAVRRNPSPTVSLSPVNNPLITALCLPARSIRHSRCGLGREHGKNSAGHVLHHHQ